jgi:hypothetical protein
MTIWLKLGVGLAALTLPAVLREAGYAADAAPPTVVELFQRQGCSVQPAAANVAAISDRPDVLALSFAVDYWDRLRLEGHVLQARLDGAPIRLRPCDET